MSSEHATIYLDHAATTPVRPEVLEAMLPFFTEHYGNPSSIHRVGRRANSGLDKARRQVAAVLGARPGDLVFTGGGSESDNAALRGIALARRRQSGANRLITTPIEHKAIVETAEDLRDHFGFELTLLPVDAAGRVDPDDVAAEIDRDPASVAVVSVMLANNEVGTVQPLSAIGEHCRSRQIPLHSDTVQAAGRLPLKVDELGVDALSLSAHKFYGPKGVGILYLRSGTPYQTFLTGGSQEQSRRAGTVNVPGAAGLGEALTLVEAERAAEAERQQGLRDRLIDGILSSIEGARLTGHPQDRLPNHASFLLPGVEAEGVLIGLDMAGIAASSGSACSSASQRPSHVLEAMGIPSDQAVGALRLSLGRSTTATQIDRVLETLPRIVAQIRGSLPVSV